MKKNPSNGLVTLINSWKVNKALLASKAGMSAYTLKMKLLGTNPQYKLTEADEEKLKEVLKGLAAEIETVAGISFNKALATIAKKKV
jgi:hypothetical protein